MRKTIALGLVALLVSAASAAEVINVEFKFTPFVGDPQQADMVKTVAGMARVFINNVPYAEQEIGEDEVPVMFAEREVAPAVWLPTESCGPALRKGKNTFRIEFTPVDAQATYQAQLRWVSVMDETTEEGEGGQYSATNQGDEGMQEKKSKGEVAFEREFRADFAADLPWHHYPAVTSLTEADKQALAALLVQRIGAFQPDFSKLYALLEGNPDVDLAAVKEARCLDQGYEAGIRIAAPPVGGVDFVASGGPEVVMRAHEGDLFFPADIAAFERIEDEDTQMCIGMALSLVYPPRLAAVRSPSGAWEIVY